MSFKDENSDNIGRLFVFEGPDDVGKTTLASMLSRHLTALGKENQILSFPGREAGTLSELVYRFYHDPIQFGVANVSAIAMQVLVTAAHIEVIEARLKPLLQSGVDVVLDRYWWSTYVYAHVEGVPDDIRNMMIKLEMHSWGKIQPEYVFLVDRQEPLLAQPSIDLWSQIRHLYKELGEREGKQVRVTSVANDGRIEDSFKTIICSQAEREKDYG